MNSLLKQGSVLSQFYAEEHPSDGNYLAVAGGSTFGVPLDDPEEENPLYTIPAGASPRVIVVTPNGRTAHALDWGGNTVTPIDTATDTAQRPIQVGSFPAAIAISPRGGTAYVANYGSDTVTPITLATETAGRVSLINTRTRHVFAPVTVGNFPVAVAISP